MLADAPAVWHWEADASQRTLVERDASGARLLREAGPLGRLRVTARPRWAPLGRVEFSGAAAYADLRYEGRTQSGAPLSTHTHHAELEAGARWLPSQPYAWGTPSLTLDALWFRRAIQATSTVNGLVETSVAWMPGLAWESPRWSVAGWPVVANLGWRTSVDHRLTVNFAGVFDESALRGGRRNEWAAQLRTFTSGGWSVGLKLQRMRQTAGDVATLYRLGVPAGTVREPRLSIDDVGLVVSRDF